MRRSSFLKTRFISILVALLSLIACGGGGGSSFTSDVLTVNDLEDGLRQDLDNLVTDTDFTLLIQSADGKRFSHSIGSSSETTSYQSASTSKLVTAAVILSLVDKNQISLSDHPQDYIPGWPTTGKLANIELRHLLNFTSGLTEQPLCMNFSTFDFESCVLKIDDLNGNSSEPGEEFYYSGAHMQVAGLMAIRAAGLSTWRQLFDQFKSETGLFASSRYDLPSLQNPRLAGGMHWTAEEYVAFLEALYDRTLLSSALLDEMFSDQIASAEIANSPALNGIDEDWHYGFGNWIECYSSQYDCTTVTRISSSGAYGAYPFIDFENGYYGVVARQGAPGTFEQGYEVFTSVAETLSLWATTSP